jgi:hypothetical protein
MMKPVIHQKFVGRDWETGQILKQFDLGDYEATWGSVHYMFHRQDLHKGLLHAATSEEGKGTPCKFVVNHTCDRPLAVYTRALSSILAARASITRLALSLSRTAGRSPPTLSLAQMALG